MLLSSIKDEILHKTEATRNNENGLFMLLMKNKIINMVSNEKVDIYLIRSGYCIQCKHFILIFEI